VFWNAVGTQKVFQTGVKATFMKYTYLLVDILTIAVPLIFSFHPRIRFDKKFVYFFAANITVAACFLAWDIFFTDAGVWGFNEHYTLGIHVINLPVEEVLFFICIPFACLFTYHCLNRFFDIGWSGRAERLFVLLFSFSLLLIGLINLERAYTAASFLSTGIMLLVFKFVIRVRWLPQLLHIYPLLLIPFFIVNGILTGTGLQQPVVWYNGSENLGIRLLTIPVEDVFYGLGLIMANVFLYEKFQGIISGKPAELKA
jgi:lycopene cyclase domain-containing protein